MAPGTGPKQLAIIRLGSGPASGVDPGLPARKHGVALIVAGQFLREVVGLGSVDASDSLPRMSPPSASICSTPVTRAALEAALSGHLAPDFKTIADFREDNGGAILEVCRQFVTPCRKLDLLSAVSVAIDGSKFKAVNARDKNFTEAKMKRRLERIDESIARYLSQLLIAMATRCRPRKWSG